MYLYRAVDGQGNTVEFYLSRTRGIAVAHSGFYRSGNPICTRTPQDPLPAARIR